MDKQTILLQITQGDWEDVDKEIRFLDSLQKSHHLEYLTRHTVEELVKCAVFKVRGQDIGFAITPEYEIVSVHNNSNFRGLGKHLVRKAVELGGRKVFHFDGFLTGFYKSLGFLEDRSQRLAWDEAYAPKHWRYQPIDIVNPDFSVYADEIRLEALSRGVIAAAKERYDAGKPDVITRLIDNF